MESSSGRAPYEYENVSHSDALWIAGLDPDRAAQLPVICLRICYKHYTHPVQVHSYMRPWPCTFWVLTLVWPTIHLCLSSGSSRSHVHDTMKVFLCCILIPLFIDEGEINFVLFFLNLRTEENEFMLRYLQLLEILINISMDHFRRYFPTIRSTFHLRDACNNFTLFTKATLQKFSQVYSFPCSAQV